MAKWNEDARKITVIFGGKQFEYARTDMNAVSTKLGRCSLRYRLIENGIEIISEFDVETKEGKRKRGRKRHEYHGVQFLIKKASDDE